MTRHGATILGALILLLPGLTAAQVNPDRSDVLSDVHGYFPCSDCHADQETIHQPRVLVDEHEIPLEWEDEDGNQHLVAFGQLVAIADLLGSEDAETMEAQNLARIGQRIRIAEFMDDEGLAPEDSVWTLVHGGGNLWCLDCHNADDRDYLVKLNGELLTFNESHLLCGECHGPKLRDWQKGIHGKSTGYWNADSDVEGVTRKLLCVECHTPHSPAFPMHQPLAGPVARVGGEAHHGAPEDQHEESDH